MVDDSDKINTLILEVRTEIPAITRSIEADSHWVANVEAREGNKVAIIVRPKLVKPFPRGTNRLRDRLD